MYQIELLIGADSKLSELILEYPDILGALSHLNIRLGFGEASIREIAERYQLNLDALTAIVATYCNRLPHGKTIPKEALSDLLAFQKNSHTGFNQKQIPELKALIASFADEVSEKHGKMLISFFDGYIREVHEHFKYEEETVFPYIDAILENRRTKGFAIHEFEKNHTDIGQKLYDLKNILIKYMPEETDTGYRRRILYYLFSFEKQLAYHNHLEDYVLAPSVREVEKKSNEKATTSHV
ncbi:MAG: hemerythrin domain-containing protein [Bacteroidales bacterium]|jgi:regulator of cell morphogenesis and NO signaling|nr:hemerythrin domain-containing protein [Bacteroidales bacterium]